MIVVLALELVPAAPLERGSPHLMRRLELVQVLIRVWVKALNLVQELVLHLALESEIRMDSVKDLSRFLQSS